MDQLLSIKISQKIRSKSSSKIVELVRCSRSFYRLQRASFVSFLLTLPVKYNRYQDRKPHEFSITPNVKNSLCFSFSLSFVSSTQSRIDCVFVPQATRKKFQLMSLL